MASQRDQPNNLEGVLRLAVENTSTNNSAATMAPMTSERQEFLREALSGIQGDSPVKRLQTIVVNLRSFLQSQETDPTREVLDALYEELEELTDWCENIDWACDFHKIGGYEVLAPLQNYSSEFRWRCGDLIAALCENNPYCQEHMLADTDQLDRLMKQALCESECDTVRFKALRGLSGILRGNAEGQTQFVGKDGYSFVLRCMQSSIEKLRIKSTFLLTSMMHEDNTHKEELTRVGCVEQLLSMLTSGHNDTEYDPYHEALLASLLALLTDNPSAVAEARRPELRLRETLEGRIKLLQGREECQDELDSATRILEQVFESEQGADVLR